MLDTAEQGADVSSPRVRLKNGTTAAGDDQWDLRVSNYASFQLRDDTDTARLDWIVGDAAYVNENLALTNQRGLRLRENEANGGEYVELKPPALLAASRSHVLNIVDATCTGGLNGGALTVVGGEIVCSDDDGGAGAETNSLETVTTGILDDEVPTGSGAGTVVYKAIPDCHTGSMLTYATGTNTWGCEADDLGAGGGDAIRVEDGDNGAAFTAATDPDFDDSGDIDFQLDTGATPDTIIGVVRANSVALGTDTSGVLPIAEGGLNLTTYADQCVLVATSANVLGCDAGIAYDDVGDDLVVADSITAASFATSGAAAGFIDLYESGATPDFVRITVGAIGATDRTYTFPDVADAGITVIGQTVETAEITDANVTEAKLASEDYGSFTCGAGADDCAIDAASVTEPMLASADFGEFTCGAGAGDCNLDDDATMNTEAADNNTTQIATTAFVQQEHADSAGSCTDQVVTAVNADAAPTCANVSSAMIAADVITAADVAASLDTRKCGHLYIESAADADQFVIRLPPFAGTMTRIDCEAFSGTSAVINICDGEDLGDDTCTTSIPGATMTCDTTGANDTTLTNPGFAARDKVTLVIVGAPTGTVNLDVYITCTVD